MNKGLFPKDISDKLPTSLRVQALLYFILSISGSILIIEPKNNDFSNYSNTTTNNNNSI